MITFVSTLVALLFGRLLARWCMEWFPPLAKWPNATYSLAAGLACSQLVGRALSYLHVGLGPALYGMSMVAVLSVALAVPLVAGWRFVLRRAMDAPSPGPALAALVAPPPPPPPDAGGRSRVSPLAARSVSLGRRRALEVGGAAVAFGGVGSAFARGYLTTRFDYEIREVVVAMPGWPRALEGYVLAQVSDLHAGTFMDERRLRAGLDRVRETKCDLLVVTGDLVDFDPALAPLVARAIHDVAGRDGVVGILGNHDAYAGPRQVASAMRSAGIRTLVNDGYVHRPNDGGGFALLGLDDSASSTRGGELPDLGKALSKVPSDRPRLLLAHQPRLIEQSGGSVALQLSGHTHGGQIGFAGYPLRALGPYIDGRFLVNGTTLWVNRGFGTSGPPTRVGVRPEISRIVLVSA